MASQVVRERPQIAPARLAAFRILEEMERSTSAHSDTLLHGHATERLSQQDRNLTTTLVMGVLRWQLALDSLIQKRLHHAATLDDAVAIALRLGAFQLLLLDRIPTHAAIHDSVELVKRAGHRFAAGLVNAVLRKLAAERPLSLDPLDAHPEWMVDRWRTQLGHDAAAKLCAYDQQTPRTTLRLPDDTASPGGVMRGEFLTRAGVLADQGSVIRESGVRRSGIRGQESGGFTVHADARGARDAASHDRIDDPMNVELRYQDEGSQLIAELAGAGRRILDCCAAPGGKAAILAERNPSAEIIACDISRARLQQMRQSFARETATSRIQCVEMDATDLRFEAPFDLILCDAPCSGTGTLARNPEIKLRLRAEDLERQQRRQMAILHSAMGCLARGGSLIYSTCSLEPEENEDVVQKCLESEPEMRLLPMAERLSTLERSGAVHAEGADRLREHALRPITHGPRAGDPGTHGDLLQTVPGVLLCDGFFAAVLTRA
jgi:16S rRNA (cytosine967-C5)-methyltransferase